MDVSFIYTGDNDIHTCTP